MQVTNLESWGCEKLNIIGFMLVQAYILHVWTPKIPNLPMLSFLCDFRGGIPRWTAMQKQSYFPKSRFHLIIYYVDPRHLERLEVNFVLSMLNGTCLKSMLNGNMNPTIERRAASYFHQVGHQQRKLPQTRSSSLKAATAFKCQSALYFE